MAMCFQGVLLRKYSGGTQNISLKVAGIRTMLYARTSLCELEAFHRFESPLSVYLFLICGYFNNASSFLPFSVASCCVFI
jgi:hypothetical protein